VYFYSHESKEPPHVHVDRDQVSCKFWLSPDGRTISAPLAWYPRLLNATPSQRANCQIAGAGYGVHWPEIDEDLSVEGLLRGAPAPHAGGTGHQPLH
jgi:hypothetical protein